MKHPTKTSSPSGVEFTPHDSRQCLLCVPVPSFPDVKSSEGTWDHS
jgi:hypothetical protein